MAIPVKITEIGPRDGFQSVCNFIPTEQKLEIIKRIVESGMSAMQVTSFISPRAIPQMSDAAEVAAECVKLYPELTLCALVPNRRGAQNALAAGIKRINLVISVSEEHNRANVNKTVAESFADLRRIRDDFPEMNITLDVATAFGCPFTGRVISQQEVIDHIGRGIDAGADEFCVCDTTGIALPAQVSQYSRAVLQTFPGRHFSIHIHDTRNLGIMNTMMAVEAGITDVQTALGGLGGCPFAPGASGNTSTEDLVYLLNSSGYETGVDFEKLLSAARYEYSVVDGNFSGHQIRIGIETF